MDEQGIAFIGGGNMAGAIITGMLAQGYPAGQLQVVEPLAETRARLQSQFGIVAQAQAGPLLREAGVVVWAVKPQSFRDAARQAGPHTGAALHLSVAAGIPSASIALWLSTQRVVRAMPNTPALIGRGITAFYARAAVSASDRQRVEQVIRSTGDWLWVDAEDQLDAVTALSGSGPAYVYYFIEAMTSAGAEMGLTSAQARQLAVATFSGAAELARASDEPVEVLRERVTSKGGTTFAAISALEEDGVKPRFKRALHAAQLRAQELGREFGAD